MDIESLRDYCLSLPLATEDFPFDESTLVFRIAGKIFAMVDLENTEWFVLKCNPDYALTLRDAHPEITGAWHMNKKHWNQINLYGTLTDELIQSLIRHSYNEVLKKLSRRVREEQKIALIHENSNTLCAL
ncbi:MAG: MmcQ/YjbR family DNA-binding protein [Bacteroidaceae bacterium]|nr:MmcQ/YjbR family DNA-binding protein [Bacteroidaceae bacterium]